MKTQKHFLALLTIMIVFNACSIEKKHASFGYHIEWRNNKFSKDNKVIAQKLKPKAAKEKTTVTPFGTNLILETIERSDINNQVLNNDKVSTIKKVMFSGVRYKTKKVIKNNPSLVKQKMPFIKQSNDNKLNPNYFLLLAALFSGITILILPYYNSIFYVIFLFLCLICLIIWFIFYMIKFIKQTLLDLNL